MDRKLNDHRTTKQPARGNNFQSSTSMQSYLDEANDTNTAITNKQANTHKKFSSGAFMNSVGQGGSMVTAAGIASLKSRSPKKLALGITKDEQQYSELIDVMSTPGL